MDSVIRAAIVYFALLLLLRIAGNRSLGQITMFDFVLLLIISEAVQNAMIRNDYSLINSMLVVGTLVLLDVLLALLKRFSPRVELLIDGAPMLLVSDGKLLRDRMKKSLVDEQDILEAARELQGLERLEQVKYAVLERGGNITIIPRAS